MAHYAFLDENNIVTEVIVGKDEGEDNINWEQHYGSFRNQVCKRTSYNTTGGVLDENTCLWNPPTPAPNDGKMYSWNEETTSWVEVNGA